MRGFATECVIVLGLMAAGIVPAGAAERVARAQDIARPCPRYGSGFVRLPGSDLCVRLEGRVTGGIDARTRYAGPGMSPAVAGRLSIDTRTESDYGPVRTFVRIRPSP